MKLPHALRTLHDFGRRRLTGVDFMELIRRCGIELTFSTQTDTGYYYYSACGRHVIVLSANIPRAKQVQVGWHEFGHYLQNFRNPVPMQAGYCQPGNRTPEEQTADAFAFVCVTGVPLAGRRDFLENLMSMNDHAN